jgi:hypothetical protein
VCSVLENGAVDKEVVITRGRWFNHSK